MNQDVYKSNEKYESRWSALDPDSRHPMSNYCKDDDNEIEQDATQKSSEYQLSEELIYIKDSCNVEINSTDVKAALSLQAALQAAIAVVISISIADGDRADKVTQDLLQSSKITQITRQKTIVENSRDIDIRTTDAQVAVNIQLLLQLLLALIVELDIL
ncbi:spore coat protein [Bacillus sp. CECT 9360]|uniref:spore coat protein n=1 Tax=Bacillus sp. CECT 9360 TaxID=2845821 RepID=UPI001E2AF33E|nr:spore coat protein [Bacillus sp. CECT 9360]CAH0344514.1 Spore coat protein X [Bacillus sp. CECT 9360]